MLLDGRLQKAFNAISTIDLSSFNFWFHFISCSVVILLTLLVVGLASYQVQNTSEITFVTFLLTVTGLLFSLAVFIGLMAV